MKYFATNSIIQKFSACCLSLFCFTLFPAAGDLDSTFGTGGKVTTDFGGTDQGYSVAIQSDGKIVVAGATSTNFALARYSTDGSLDSSFGTGGKVTTNFGGTDIGYSVAIQSDGKIIVAGVSSGNFALARYNTDGSLDTSFGTGGKVTTDFGGTDSGRSVAIQSDGKIVVAGSALNDFALARYTTDGSLDASFGTAGKVTTDFGGTDGGRSVAIQSDGKIVVAGVASFDDFALARYNADGSLDASFGTGGKVITDFGGADEGYSVAIQSDGKIVVAGFASNDFALARYTTDGSLDASFGTGGKLTTDFGGTDEALSVAIQFDGKIIAVGNVSNDFGLARYNTDGSLDTSFGIDGKVITDFDGKNRGYSVAIQPDGKIVVAGFALNDFAVARYIGNNSEFLNSKIYNALVSKYSGLCPIN